MGKVLSIMLRQPRRIFAQERAERVISKSKPTMHPFYPTEEKIMKQIKAEHPELDEQIRHHQPQLDDRVGRLRITSHDAPVLDEGGNVPKLTRPTTMIESGSKDGDNVRLLPQSRVSNPEPEFGFVEPPDAKVARGRILFSKAMKLLELRAKDDAKARQFATELGLNDSDSKRMLDYFVPFTRWVDLADDQKKPEAIIDTNEHAVGHRAFLQRQRLVSELEKRRITARMLAVTGDEETTTDEKQKQIEDEKKT